MPITNILLPVDGSNHSGHAVEYAIYLAKLSGASIYAVTCYELMSAVPEVTGILTEQIRLNAEKHAAGILENAEQLMKEAGVNYITKTFAGSPGNVLTDLARSKEFDLIIMGSHGHSDIAGLFLGSVTHKVLNTIYCPVMVVP
jgi:nucleotide-binding universal stress UspA family protein